MKNFSGALYHIIFACSVKFDEMTKQLHFIQQLHRYYHYPNKIILAVNIIKANEVTKITS